MDAKIKPPTARWTTVDVNAVLVLKTVLPNHMPMGQFPFPISYIGTRNWELAH